MPLPETDDADHAHCAALIRQGSRSFHAASLLLPRRVRGPAYALYAFCRLADDAVDGVPGAAPIRDRASAVRHLAGRLERVYGGSPLGDPVERAFAEAVARHAIPRALPEALLDGLAWDAEGRRYATLDALTGYAARVAGAVGAMMALVMGVRGRRELARAADLGVAMQFTNIARDVGEDAAAGRIYLPLDWLAEAGIAPESLLDAPRPSPRLASVTRRLLAEADRLYVRAEAGIARLPVDCAPAILAARLIYAEIGREVARAGYDNVTRRAVVPGARKLALAAGAWPRAGALRLLPPPEASGPLAETRFLVDAVAPAILLPRRARGAEFVLDLFAEMAVRDDARRRVARA